MRIAILRNLTPIRKISTELGFFRAYSTTGFSVTDIERMVFFAGRLFWLSDFHVEEGDWLWHGRWQTRQCE